MMGVNVAIVGATGMVGQALCQVLAARDFPIDNLYLLASKRSAGQQYRFKDNTIEVTQLADFDFKKVHWAFFSAGRMVSEQYAPKAAAAGAYVVDNTSAFRYTTDVPLVVPEINAHVLNTAPPQGIIANPNCSTIQMLVALNPIHQTFGLSRIEVCTYQAVSGAGHQAVEALKASTQAVLDKQPVHAAQVLPRPMAFDVLPQVDTFQDNGYTREEMKMVWETHKILEDKDILVNPTCVRVPVMIGHSEAIHFETRAPTTLKDISACLKEAPGLSLAQKISDYPMAQDAAGQDSVLVGRLRQVPQTKQSFNLWCVGDNIRKGAATNSVQIAEYCLQQGWC